MDTTYVFGHKNPDTDSICSAISYAYLKNTQAEGHLPVRLGELNRESRFVLDTFGVEAPPFLPHIHLRVQDVMTRDVVSASTASTVYEVGELMRQHGIQAVPLLDDEGRALGVVTERTLARNYLKELHLQSLHDEATPLARIARTLEGRLLVGDPDRAVTGDAVIGAMNVESMMEYVSPGDLVILGNRENAQEAALGGAISCLVVTGGFDPSPRIQEMARERGTAIIVTPFDTFAAARLINLSVSALRLLNRDVLAVGPDNLVAEVTPDLLEAQQDIALVNDDAGRLVGVLTKGDVLARRRRQVILVDHSERSQSADGIERAEILEILDHHRLGGLETANPILALIAPVGCTATLVLRRYRDLGVEPPREMAGLMVSAILSDTMLLKSPTTTEEDVRAVDYLGERLGEDPLTFGRRMYDAKFDVASTSPAKIVTNDLKTFQFGQDTVGIGQLEVADKEGVLARKGNLLEAMEAHRVAAGFDLLVLMVTDIFREGTELLAVGRTRAVERAFDASLDDHALWLPGVLSRKKQVVPPLASAY